MFVPASDLTVGSLSVEAKWTVVDAFLGITYKRSMKGKKAAYKWLYIQHGRTHSVKLGIISPFQTLCQEEHAFISLLNRSHQQLILITSLQEWIPLWRIKQEIVLSVTFEASPIIYCHTFTNEIEKGLGTRSFFYVITNVIGLVAALLALISWCFQCKKNNAKNYSNSFHWC